MLPIATREPDWFYSTLAQSTAAVVGLAGAFLIQRLLVERERIGRLRGDVRRSARKVLKSIEGLRDNTSTVLESLQKIRREAKQQAPPWTVVSHIYLLAPDGSVTGQLGLSEAKGFDSIAVLDRAIGVLSEVRSATEEFSWERLCDDLRRLGGLHQSNPSWISDREFRARARRTQFGTAIWQRVQQQDQVSSLLWQKLVDQSLMVNAELEELRTRGIPRALYVLLAVLSALFFSGVVAPLIFLNGLPGSSKWFLLTLFGLLSLAFVGFFWSELRRLRRADRLEDPEF
ncbi:MAG TPA: hypothetical protein VGK66_02105 [Solirubrobacterales bacterium]|nr:hypothetical protein [Solirubrobacterales bacterium]